MIFLRHDLINDIYLVIKMPSTIHEFVSGKIKDSIKMQLAAIKENSNEPTKRLIESIGELSSRRIKFHGSDGHRAPDGQFLIEGSYYPGVVVEVAYSQSFKSLKEKAENFIVGSNGSIQLVIGLETESKTPYQISAWRPGITRSGNQDVVTMGAVIEQDVIQESDGKLKPGSMTFQLKDFGTNLATTYPNAHLTKVIALHYNDLADYLAQAKKFDVQLPPRPNTIQLRQLPASVRKLTNETVRGGRRWYGTKTGPGTLGTVVPTVQYGTMVRYHTKCCHRPPISRLGIGYEFMPRRSRLILGILAAATYLASANKKR